ncbi:MAG: BMP family ABC transporter substrate-binding protein [Bacillota bacterium]|nr:BMP family ABC transporter substrate-binding protein [Bacillota bacterium]
MKKLLTLVLTAAMVLSFAACGNKTENKGTKAEKVKFGVILIGDETEGYTLAHINGIKAAAKELGISNDQIIWDYKVSESADCKDKAEELALKGCKVIFANSYGHQTYLAQAAQDYPNTTFVAMTGDFAAISGLKNLKNAFTNVYESRYVSGVVAGLKLQELVQSGKLSPQTTPSNYDANGNIKIGYVGAFNYAEVISGYTAFYLGIKSIVNNVSMQVTYTNSWFDIEKEGAAAESLIANGCVIIGQHADSTGAPAAVEAANKEGKICYSVGYNISMLDVAPTAALTSASNNWAVYYKYAMESAMNGKEIATDWAKGYSEDAVKITDLGKSCAKGTSEKVAEVIKGIKDGSIKVFDTSKFTVKGAKITTAPVDLSYYDFSSGSPVCVYKGKTVDAIKTQGAISYFDESSFRAAPYFKTIIDGITEK